MKRTTLAFLGVAALTLGAGALKGQEAQAGVVPPEAPSPAHVPRFAQVLADLVTKYDANKDGQLDATELATMQADAENGKLVPPRAPRVPHMPEQPGGGPPLQLLEEYDADKDGHLNESERAALQADIDSGKIVFPLRRGVPHAKPTSQQVLDKFDADKNGSLDATEIEAMLNEAGRMGQPPMHSAFPPHGRPRGQ